MPITAAILHPVFRERGRSAPQRIRMAHPGQRSGPEHLSEACLPLLTGKKKEVRVAATFCLPPLVAEPDSPGCVQAWDWHHLTEGFLLRKPGSCHCHPHFGEGRGRESPVPPTLPCLGATLGRLFWTSHAHSARDTLQPHT